MNDKPAGFHMDMETFRRNGYAVIDWLVDYYRNVESYPVLAQVEPDAVRSKLPQRPPLRGESFEAMLRDVEDFILPGISHWQSPNFFAFFPANSSPPAILGEILSAGLGVQGMLWATSPACTEVETLMMDWLVEMLGLPEKFTSRTRGGGVIQDSASSATLCALLAARERATRYESNKSGCDGSLIAYASTQSHSSIEKACMIAGIGTGNLRKIDVDDSFTMRPDRLVRQIQDDKSSGLIPFFVCGCVGTTSSLALDPIPKIARICKEHGLWLHIDAAMAGSAAVCPEFRFINEGVHDADSYTFNPHKWMFTNFDCNAFFVDDRATLINALSILPEYLRNQATESGAVIDYRDWQIPLGRRFRALKLWFVIRHYGIEGLQYHIRRHVELARMFAQWIRASDVFDLVVESSLNLICFTHRAGDEFTEKLMHYVNATGKIYLTHTRLNGTFTLRISIGQTYSEIEHVERAWELLQQASNKLSDAAGVAGGQD
ncbi:MAG: pyridoxal-dependent decarboxylase [Gammaproteobacteria bacterium]